MGNDIELYSKINDPLNAIERLGKFIGESGMFGCTKVQQGMVIATVCLARRIDPLEFIQTYHLIQGRPSMRTDKMLARFQERGGKVKILARSAERAAIVLTPKDGEPIEFSLTWDEAEKEPFVWVFQKDKEGKPVRDRNGKAIKLGLKDNYATPRARMQMLWARVVSDAIRAVDPGVNSGLYAPEEHDDVAEEASPALFSQTGETGQPVGAPGEKVVTGVEMPEGGIPGAPPPAIRAATLPGGFLTDETVKALVVAIGGVAGDLATLAMAKAFLRSVKWLGEDQDWECLSVRRAQMILDRPAEFVAKARQWQEERKAAAEAAFEQKDAKDAKDGIGIAPGESVSVGGAS